MPKYEVTDSVTGKTLELEGDSPPTDEELASIFDSVQKSQPEKKPGLLESFGKGAVELGKSFVKPAVEYGKFLGESVAQAGRSALDPTMRTDIGAAQKESSDYMTRSKALTQQAMQVQDPAEKRRLLDQARSLAQSADASMSRVRSMGESQQTFFTKPEELTDRGDIALTGLKRTAGAAAYAVPAGKAGSVGQAIASGAASGALSGVSESERGKELSGAVTGGLLGGVTAGAMEKGGQMLKKGGEGLISKFVKAPKEEPVSEMAVGAYKSMFQVPKNKSTRGLDPTKTSRTLLEYGVSPTSLDDLIAKSQVVTGRDGELPKAVREVLGNIPEEVDISNAPNAAKNALRGQLGFDTDDINKITNSINNILPEGQQINKANALDAFDVERKLQEQANLYKLSYDATKDPKNKALADAYFAAYETVKDELDNATQKFDLMDTIKTPERIEALAKISPKLAERFKNAKTVAELRSLQSPFVQAQQMAKLTQDQASRIFNQEISRGAQKVGMSAIGGLFGSFLGPVGTFVGTIGGAAAEPIISPITQSAGDVIRTRSAAGTAKALMALPKAKREAVNTVARALGGAGKFAGKTLQQPFLQKAAAIQSGQAASPNRGVIESVR